MLHRHVQCIHTSVSCLRRTYTPRSRVRIPLVVLEFGVLLFVCCLVVTEALRWLIPHPGCRAAHIKVLIFSYSRVGPVFYYSFYICSKMQFWSKPNGVGIRTRCWVLQELNVGTARSALDFQQ
jgi:hypothetical protein